MTKDEFRLMYPDVDSKEIDDMVIRFSKPILCFKPTLDLLNKKAIELGYESHDDFLTKTGWKDRFVNE